MNTAPRLPFYTKVQAEVQAEALLSSALTASLARAELRYALAAKALRLAEERCADASGDLGMKIQAYEANKTKIRHFSKPDKI